MSSLPASIKRIGSKTTEKWWRHHFPHYKSMGGGGGFCCHGTRVFIQSAPKPYAAFPSPQVFMPVLVTSNFDDDSIKHEQAGMETPFSHYKSMGNFLDAQGPITA